MSAACTSCSQFGGIACAACDTNVPPGELPTQWAPLPVPAIEQRVVEERNEPDALERQQ